ncbi:class I SAM-dependent methyltransferase [Thermaerobacter subterraneus]|uniref:Methylase involved in ubiquinone/menaquinone biosynthesis n=1 Tax=Thermaerobacter subterraneus DSM 13965 TaxID=867903 RepID=K6Q318_9FIRM|nr:methyltransferase domain-containing protein [Thermaerobacter subterraneus]EKP95643.1 methylase involved in ubiquinone/menaquinone biosynthesis [Thermaerobacter subterraneus DSM 13965]
MPVNTNFWNRIRYTIYSPFYDRIASFPQCRRRSIEILRPAEGERVLIIGAGSGLDIPYIPSSVHITAVDVTPAMVDRLRRRAQHLGRYVDARVMDGQALDFPSECFDAVILHLILAVIPDPFACIQEAARVLKPGGRAIVWDKFLPDHEEPSMARRLLNIFSHVAFSDINRKLGPLVNSTNLVIEHQELMPVAGLPYTIALLRKPQS